MRVRSAVAVALFGLCGVLVACGGAKGPQDETSTGAPADVLAFATGSGQKVLDADTFRFQLQDRGNAVEYEQTCNPGSDRTVGALDLGRKLAFFDLQGGQDVDVDVVVSEHTYFIRTTALKGWTVGSDWLSVPMDDLEHLNMVAIATGLKVGPTFWEGQGGLNPANLLEAMSDSVTSVSEQGATSVRGVDTTHYELTIDPAEAGLWTGGTTTSTSAPTSTTRDLTVVRQTFLDQIAQGDEAQDLPEDVKQAFLAGDPEPLIAFGEQTTSTTLDADGRLYIEAMASGDPDAFIAAEEQSTGTTLDASGRLLLQTLLGPSESDSPSDNIARLFNAMSTYEASAYVDADGLLRRLDLRVDGVGDDDATTTSADRPASFLDVSTEFWDIGTPLAEAEPDAATVTAVAALGPAAIPAQLSPCYVRLSN